MSGDEGGEKWGQELAGWIWGEGVSFEVDECAKEILRGPKKTKHDGDDVPKARKPTQKEIDEGIEVEDDAREKNKTPFSKKPTEKEIDDGIDERRYEDVGEKKMEVVDLNREGAEGEGVGKGEREPKEIDPKEHITPRDV